MLWENFSETLSDGRPWAVKQRIEAWDENDVVRVMVGDQVGRGKCAVSAVVSYRELRP